MRIGIVGASASGIYAAIFLKRKHPDWKVDVFDHADKVGKKLYATGNGHCNLLNENFSGRYFNCPEFIDGLLSKYPLPKLKEELANLGIATLNKGDLIYPLSYSASSFVSYLNGVSLSLGITFHLGVEVKAYEANETITLYTSEGPKAFDKVIFAVGGLSQPALGSNGSLLNEFSNHGYAFKTAQPSLCPLKTKEKTKMISGVRHEAKITLLDNKKIVYEEVGEILFKDDGVSGIAVFNASAFIARNPSGHYELEVDLFPNLEIDKLAKYLDCAKKNSPASEFGAVLEEKFAKYLVFAMKMQGDKSLEATLKRLVFHGLELYPFASSQVTSGGLDLMQIDAGFASKKENNVSFIGEMLDVDGLCGGFNLGFALLSAYACAESL